MQTLGLSPNHPVFWILLILALVMGQEELWASPGRQDVRGPFPYMEEEVSYFSGELRLAGTLTVPQGAGPFPAVLLLTGSGPQNRDEEIFGHKPFRILSDALARAGVAVLRMDDRGVGGSEGNLLESTTEDLAEDALAGVRFLAGTPQIAHDRIGLLGHSEGALQAAIAASRSPQVAFVILLAGSGLPGDEVLLQQTELIARADGVSQPAIDRELALLRQEVDLVRATRGERALTARLRQVIRTRIELSAGNERPSPDDLERAIDREMHKVTSPWFRFIVAYDPRPALRKVRVPALVLNGEKDLQVPPDQNLPEIEKALREAGNHDVTILRLEGLNHLFQHSATGSPEEYATIAETISPEVLALTAKWIRERFVRH